MYVLKLIKNVNIVKFFNLGEMLLKKFITVIKEIKNHKLYKSWKIYILSFLRRKFLLVLSIDGKIKTNYY